MASAAQVGKKPALCRYFASTGSCGYGEDCQFLHQNPMAFQQQQSQQNFPNAFSNGPNQLNGTMNGQENADGIGSNGDQYFNATFSGEMGQDFQPFSRQRPISRPHRGFNSGSPMMPNNPMTQNGPMTPGGSPMPFNTNPMAGPKNQMPGPNGPMSHPGMMGGGPGISQNGPVSQAGPLGSMSNTPPMPQNMKQPYYSPGNSNFDSNMANDFSALNLSTTVNGKGTNPMVNEFIPNTGKLTGPPGPGMTHSASSPNIANFNNLQPPSQPPAMSINSSSAPSNQLPGMTISSSASPNHSPGMSPSNSPLMMRRMGSPVHPHRQQTAAAKAAGNTIQENVGGTTYFYSPEDFTPQHEGIALPNFSMYPAQPTHIAHMKIKSNMPQFFMPDEFKMEILSRHALTMAQMDLTNNPEIPAEVDNYHNLFPLEPPPANPHQKSQTFGYPTTCYKAVNKSDGLTYCLRRIHGFRLVNTKCMMLVDMWKKMYHPNIVQLREVFTTKAFGDHSIVFAYDFFPAAETLLSRHFSQIPPQMNGFNNPFSMDGSARPFSAGKGMNGPRQHAGLLPESQIWAYVVQLSSSLRAIHAAGLSCRTLEPSKILIYSKSRLRLNCAGIFDVLTFDSNQGNPMALTAHYQQEDLISLGKVVLALACNSVMAIQRDNLQTSMDIVARNYSTDLKNLILYLLGNQSRPRSINDIMPMIGARFYTQLDSAQLRSDVIENELAKEVENGRLFRLLCKLGTVNERPEFNLDPQWSETGDRYMLKLFRDYVFHQVDENGAPWIDIAHMVQCLNKLDAGLEEKITLMSRDEQNVLVVSYAELKKCFESAFTEVLNLGHQSGLS